MDNQHTLPPDTSSLPKNGHPKTIMLSTNTTLFWRVFVPVFSTVFWGGFAVAFLLTDIDELYLPVNALLARSTTLLFLLVWVLLMRRTLWRLKRVDADDTHLYVTNYWTTARYPWPDVENIEEKKRMGRRIVNLHLRAPGRFGRVISFLPGSLYDNWKKERKLPG